MAADSSKPWDDFAPAGKPPSGGQSEKPWEDFGGESKPEPKGFAGHARDLGISALQGAIGVPEMAVGLADIPTGGAVGKFLENKDGAVGFRPKQAREFLDTLKTDATQQQKTEFEQADGVMGKAGYALSNPSLISNAVAESLPVMGAGGLIGRGVMAAAPKLGAAVAAGAGEGIASAGSTAEQIRQETKDGELTAGQSALSLGAGAATGAFGVAGAKVAKKLGIADADTLLVQGSKGMAADATQQAAMKSIPRKVIEGAIAEGFLEELPQSASEQIIQNIALDRPWSDGVESSVVLGVLSGMAMGGGATLVQGSAQRKAADGSPAGEQDAPQDAPLLALPAPTYTGTPNDQMLQAEAERANAVAEAEARAAGIYQQRADFEAAKQGQPEQPPVNAGLELVRQAYAAQLDALQQQEQDQADVPQSSPPDGRAALEAQAAQTQAQREAGRAVMGPDDEILQSTGAVEPPHRAMGIDPAAGPLSAGAAIAVDSGVAGQMQAAAQAVTAQDAAPQAAGPLSGAAQDAGARFVAGEKWSKPGRSGYVIDRVSDDGKMAVARDGNDTFTISLDAETANGWKPEGRDLGAAQQDPAAAWNSMSTPERAAVAGRVGLPPVIANNIPRTGWEGLNSDLQARISKAMAPAAPATAPSIEGADLGNGWAKFSAESGTAGVPRAEMPQIKAEHRGAMVNFMNARGVAHQEETLPASSLKPTQAEFSREKLARAAGFEGGNRAILVSADNHILDGHHQWMAARDKGEDVRAIRLNAPIRDLIGLAHDFPSSTKAGGAAGPAESTGTRGRATDAAEDLRSMAQDAGWAERGGAPRLDEDASAYDFEAAGISLDASEEAMLIGDIFAEAAPQDEAAVMRALGFTEEEIQDVVGQKADRKGPHSAGQDGAGRAQEAGEVARTDARPQGEAGSEGGPEGLTSYTNEDIARQEAAQRATAADSERAQREADQKAQADAERDTFALTGSDRAADVMAAQGQGGLFDAAAPVTIADRRLSSEEYRNEGKSPADLIEEKADYLGRQLAMTIAEEASQKDFAPSEISSVVRMWANDERVPADSLRIAVLKHLPDFGLSDARIKQIRNALSPLNANNQEPIKSETRVDAELTAKAAPSDQEAIKKPTSDSSLFRDSSWVIKNKDTGEIVMETFDRAKVDALNTSKYEAVPILEHLQSLNKKEPGAAEQPAVGNAPSPLEALFSDLNSDSTRKANKAKKAAAKLPEAARIEYVQANFHDILMQMMEAGALEVNGFATLTEDNAPCL